MNHLLMFYWVFAYTTGFSILLYLIIRHFEATRCFNTKDDISASHLKTLLSFTLIVISETAVIYMNIVETGGIPYYLFKFTGILGNCLLFYTLPIFILIITGQKPGFKLKTALKSYAFLTWVVQMFMVFESNRELRHIILNLIFGMFTVEIVFFSLLPLIRHRKIDDRNRKRTLIISSFGLIFVPLFILFDFFSEHFSFIPENLPSGVSILPAFYIIWNITVFYFDIREKLSRSEKPSPFHGCSLSKRENEILPLLIDGLSYQQISDKLYISISTVKTHTNHIYQKTGTKNRIELMKKASG